MIESLEMLPCPFCGTAARHNTYKDESLWNHNTVDWHTIGCPSCEISMRQCDGYDEVLAAWNTREEPSPAADRARLESLETERQDLGMLVRQFSYWLNKFAPEHSLTTKAQDYLKRKGLEPKLLRDDPTY